ncbi:peptidylprolyl isomerase [Erythrobacter litoralis]|uniref:Peptidyl-prolyl cis-trans isomerase n=1 Tax=Erythrobacter litoralis (strain HTCC2594) TaxID=314225 RepID=Q2N8M0_ERYLH|nr:peptidylprolyl isomerase [Erythrobacter litoralis]ABC63971.1 peptidyl-prolyl cis-trans isomerase [Erythrobacter litoralis HTCC2594]
MRNVLALACSFALALPLAAQDEPPRSSSEGEAQQETPAPSPGQIVDASSQDEWVVIDPEDLLVMTLAPPDRGPGQASAEGNTREVVIQLMPAPFSQGWVSNIRTLARAGWYDGISVNRVQDNYVVQWGDPNYDNPEAEGEAKPLPEGLKVMGEEEYSANGRILSQLTVSNLVAKERLEPGADWIAPDVSEVGDEYSDLVGFQRGWPVASGLSNNSAQTWPIHCYGMVGVGRGYSPDTGSGAELYTVIGHAPRHLDRNIALVGRIIAGMEHLSSLPRGKGALGFYAADEIDKRTPIVSIRVASALPDAQVPRFEYLSTESESFAKYAEARANRRDPFFIQPAGGADICNIPVPIRPVAATE